MLFFEYKSIKIQEYYPFTQTRKYIIDFQKKK